MIWLIKIMLKLAVLAGIIFYGVHMYHKAIDRGNEIADRLQNENASVVQQRAEEEAQQGGTVNIIGNVISKFIDAAFGVKTAQHPTAQVIEQNPYQAAPVQQQRQLAPAQEQPGTDNQTQQVTRPEQSVQDYYRDARPQQHRQEGQE
ncbi:MAG: hypothetical protein ACLQF0_17075 [Dissulfurispiraceae bacterium]